MRVTIIQRAFSPFVFSKKRRTGLVIRSVTTPRAMPVTASRSSSLVKNPPSPQMKKKHTAPANQNLMNSIFTQSATFILGPER